MAKKNTAALADFLQNVPIFGGLENHSLERIIGSLQERRYRPGEVVFREGELGRTMYLLHDGEVEVLRASDSGKNVAIVRLGAGEVFGEMTLVELQPRSATIRVRKPALVYSMTNMDLYNLYREDHYAYLIVLQNICRTLSRRLRKADGRICEFIADGGKDKRVAKAAKSRAKA